MKAAIQIVIDGEHFPSMRAAYYAAKNHGFTGVETTFAAHLKHGATTWRELLAPLQKDCGRVATRAAHIAEEKAFMATMCAELDARKAAIREAA